MSMSVCMYVCLSAITSPELNVRSSPIFVHVFLYGGGSVLLWRRPRRSDMLRISGFVDDVIFAHIMLIGCLTSPPD